MRRITCVILPALALLLGGAGDARAQGTPELPEPARHGAVEEIAQHPPTELWAAWLDNGVRVMHRRSPVEDGRVHLSVLIAGGELVETDADRGVASAAQLAWDGFSIASADRSDVRRWARERGIRVRASVGPDAVRLRLDAPADALEDAVRLAWALVREPVVPPDAFEHWRMTQRARLAGADGASPAFAALLASTLFPDHEARLRPIEEGDVERLDADGASAWLRRQGRNPMAVAIVGGDEPSRVFSVAASYFGELADRARIGPETFAEARTLPPFRGPARAEHADARVDGAIVLRGFIGADLAVLSDARRLRLASMVMQSRLERLAPRLHADGVQVGALEGAEYPGYGLFWMQARVPAGGVERALDAFDAELASLAAHGPTDEELDRARAKVFAEIDRLFADPEFWADRLVHLDYRGMSPKHIESIVPSYATITSEQVRDAVARHDTEARRITVVLRGSRPAGK